MENEDNPKRKTPKVLVVDDEKHIARLIQVNLERAGCTVITTNNCREAYEKAESEHPDLIILDSLLPYTDGFDVIHALAINPNTKDIPIKYIPKAFT